MPPSIPSGGVSNPNQRPAGVNGTAMATRSATRDDATNAGCGRSFHGRPLVRIMNMTRICVAIDSKNHVVWNAAGEAWMIKRSPPNVRRSNNEGVLIN